MRTLLAQRWREQRSSYRPAGEPIDTRAYEVASIPGDVVARDFVITHHYARSYPAARFRFGLYRGEELAGVAVFSQPVNAATLLTGAGVELGRLVLLDDVPANGESWFVARCFHLLREQGIAEVVSFSDPVKRTALDGSAVFPGHIGTVYQALNALYTGRSSASTIRLLPDGSVIHNRALAKIRARDKGWEYASRLLVAHGADALARTGDAGAWLSYWMPRLTRGLSHGGNYRYRWGLDRRAHRHLERQAELTQHLFPYPKFTTHPEDP